MPEIPDVSPGETLESGAWGNPIRSRTVQRYTDAAERTTLNPLPEVGDLSYLTGSVAFEIWNGSWWVGMASFDYVDDQFVPAAGGTFTGTVNFNSQILGASTARLTGVGSDIAFEVGAAAGTPSWPQDYYQFAGKIDGTLRISGYNTILLDFDNDAKTVKTFTQWQFTDDINSGSVYIRPNSSLFEDGYLKVGVRPDGFTQFILQNPSTSSDGANLSWLASDGRLRVSTSSLEFKGAVKPLTLKRATAIVEGLKPISFKSKHEGDDPDRPYLGFGLEPTVDLDAALSAGTTYDGNAITAAQTRVLQDVLKRVARLERK